MKNKDSLLEAASTRTFIFYAMGKAPGKEFVAK
jgi:hypothetical protein